MEIDFQTYQDKVKACFLGKNIGGTLGAPFECYRGVFEVDDYTQDLQGRPAPNDDLDLQLVWLNAVERYSNRVNASILGEYWLSYITPSWCEYGAGKNNLRMGLCPPFSGYVNNLNRDSNGAWIRSELWACLAPGHPEIAVRYAYEDSSVDHSNEGVYAEIFTAALQSAAFVESDREKLIGIGLSYIPAECGVARAIKAVEAYYRAGRDWKEARRMLLVDFPTTFGLMNEMENSVEDLDIPEARIGYDAPCNIGITLIGWFYGQGDFGKSICIAASCGEDSDCTAGTLGALLGIIGGTAGIDQKWTKPIGDYIVTLSINKGDHDCEIPQTVTELTTRILRQTPIFLGANLCDTLSGEKGYVINAREGEALYNRDTKKGPFDKENFLDALKRQPFSSYHECALFEAVTDYHEPPYIRPNQEKKFTLSLKNRFLSQQFLNLRWLLPEGFQISPSAYQSLSLEQYHGNIGRATVDFTLTAPEILNQPKYDIILEITANGRHSRLLIPITLLNMSTPEHD